MYNINIWVYTSCGGGKVELFKPVDDFDNDRKDVRILVWGDGTTEQCALIKNIETLLERPNKNNINIIIIVIFVHIGLIHKLNTTNMNSATLSNPRLFVLRRRKFLL